MHRNITTMTIGAVLLSAAVYAAFLLRVTLNRTAGEDLTSQSETADPCTAEVTSQHPGRCPPCMGRSSASRARDMTSSPCATSGRRREAAEDRSAPVDRARAALRITG